MNINDYGYNDYFAAHFAAYETSERLIPARISAVFKHVYRVVSEDGEQLAKLKTSSFRDALRVDRPSIGDFVALESHPGDTSLIHQVLPRKTIILRDDPDIGEQVVAANFDYCLLVCSANDDFNLNRIERYLTIAWNSGAQPLIIVTKSDLTDQLDHYLQQLEIAGFGVPVYPVDSIHGDGLAELQAHFAVGDTLVLLGSSGVGKSSLVNALAGEYKMKTNAIREDDAKGKHTTTHRELHLLHNGMIVIDTPGMRSLGIGQASTGLEETFHDIESLAEQCRFHDCAHTQDQPDCAVQQALAEGTLPTKHYNNWLKLKKELAYNERKNNVTQLRQEKQKWKTLSKTHKQNSKNRANR
ncbi:ribosome small subunit-dependent GTPase A [Paenibacillus sp. KACC 21273]|uniref:ribosome small subunit-dependent GTPase A n=1 Tax=Paenibacillus sp. KACC 21273 TaxID=3025665 RepID=UPI002366BFCA|nr:ribosome small subunit-dependent GTPase A [Paenibacillus sp. KACC 21273]WDF48960.1 ribosome small subunit-dependent GTPase A [Paenibacillus sp. KACC 21273]